MSSAHSLKRSVTLFFLFLTLFVLGIFLLNPTESARFFWQREHQPKISLLLNHSDAHLAMEIGNFYFGMGGYDTRIAKKAFVRALLINPDVLWGHYSLARILFVEGDFDGALREANEELAHHPDNLRSLYVRGLVYATIGNFSAAEKDFERFTLWAPTEWAGYNDLAWVEGKQAKYKEAEETVTRAFKEAHGAETNPWLWNNLGVQQLNEGKYKEASLSFEKAEQFANALDEKTWRSAYPGNDPRTTLSGLSEFRSAISSNKAKALKEN